MGGIIEGIGSLFGGNHPQNASFTAQGPGMQQFNQAQGQVQGGLSQQQQLINALNSQNGIGNQSNVFNQLQGVANGTGPNPAQAMLNQATGQNTANQAALMAGQRGASGNVGLMGRQIAQQGAANQQNLAGQGATLQANQSLNALNQMGGLANQQAQNQIGSVGNYNQFAQGNQGQILSSIGNQNSTNEDMAKRNAEQADKQRGGFFNALGGVASGLGNMIFNEGGQVENPKLANVAQSDRFQGALYPSHLKAVADIYHDNKMWSGGRADFRQGGTVPGEPEVNRDSPKNDTVDAKLSPKEIVLPISVTQHENAPEEAAKFVAALQKKSNPEKDFKEALKKAISGRKTT